MSPEQPSIPRNIPLSPWSPSSGSLSPLQLISLPSSSPSNSPSNSPSVVETPSQENFIQEVANQPGLTWDQRVQKVSQKYGTNASQSAQLLDPYYPSQKEKIQLPKISLPKVSGTRPGIQLPKVGLPKRSTLPGQMAPVGTQLPPARELPPVKQFPPVRELPPSTISPPMELPPVRDFPPARELPPSTISPPMELPPVRDFPPARELPLSTKSPQTQFRMSMSRSPESTTGLTLPTLGQEKIDETTLPQLSSLVPSTSEEDELRSLAKQDFGENKIAIVASTLDVPFLKAHEKLDQLLEDELRKIANKLGLDSTGDKYTLAIRISESV